MLSFCMTICWLQTARTDDRSQLCVFFSVFKLPRDYMYQGSKIIITSDNIYIAAIMQGQCEGSLGLFDECRLSAKMPPTLRPSQLTWAASSPVGCYHLHPTSLLNIITQADGWYSFYRTIEGGRLSRPKWLATYWDGLPTYRWSPIQAMGPI